MHPPVLQPLFDLLNYFPTRRLFIIERDFEIARDELQQDEAVPLLPPALSLAIVTVWQGLTEQLVFDAGPGAELLHIEVHRNGWVEPFFNYPRDEPAEGA